MYGQHVTLGSWTLMLHGNVFAGYDVQGAIAAAIASSPPMIFLQLRPSPRVVGMRGGHAT